MVDQLAGTANDMSIEKTSMMNPEVEDKQTAANEREYRRHAEFGR